MSNCALTPILQLSGVKSVLQKSAEESDYFGENYTTDNIVEDNNEDQNKVFMSDWLQSCCISVSPMLDFVCIARGPNASFFQGDPKEDGPIEAFKQTWEGSLCAKSDTISNVLCLPLVSNKHSSIGHPDWTCIVVGFSTGVVSFYTEGGIQLMSQKFHQSAVVDIKCQTGDHRQFEIKKLFNPKNELTILYEDALVVIDGNILFHNLRTCRTQQALVAAGRMLGSALPTVTFKKLKCIGHEKMSCHSSPCVMDMSAYDELQTACVVGGYNADVSFVPSSIYQLVACGTAPFIGFYHSTEITSDFALGQVASAVANKLKTALSSAASGWLNWSQKTEDVQTPTEPKIEPGIPVEIKFGLPDLQRYGTSIVLAPYSKCLAAVTDSFGRVVLLDVAKGYVLRMWKGYRDAQVAFIRVFDDTEDGQRTVNKSTLFLIVYAPRRGILEVWSCLYGPRVGAFNISRRSRLLSIGYGMLSAGEMSTSSSSKTLSCCLLNEDGEINNIHIPFHLALSDSKSNRARHIHLLKKISKLLQEKPCNIPEIIKLHLKMDLCTFQKQAFEKIMLIESIDSDTLLDCLEKMMLPLQSKEKSKEDALFYDFLLYVQSVIVLFKNVQTINADKQQDMSMEDHSSEPVSDDIFTQSLWKTIEQKQDLIGKYNAFVVKHCSPIQEEGGMTISQMLKMFLSKDQNTDNEKGIWHSSFANKLGKLLFSQSIVGNVDPALVISNLKEYGHISEEEWVLLLFNYFIRNENLFIASLKASTENLCKFVLAFQQDFKRTSVSFWQNCSKMCTETKESVAGLIVALVCKSCLQQANVITNKKTDPPQQTESPEKEWESLCLATDAWVTLIDQLSDCISLNTFLAIGFDISADVGENLNESLQCVSVNEILTSGKGFVPEIVSRMLEKANISCHTLFGKDAQESDLPSEVTSDNKLILYRFWKGEIEKQFSFCLDANTLHAHCLWDQAVAWNKNVAKISHLEKLCTELNCIKCDPHLKHGLALMAWKTFVVNRFSAMASLLDKVGKPPKDRLCMKDIGIHDCDLQSFCQYCTTILGVMAESDFDQFPKHNLNSGDRHGILGSTESWGGITGKESIVHIAKLQPASNFNSAQHLIHLSIFMHGITRFQLRGIKPLTHLFDANVKSWLFVDNTAQSHRSPASLKTHVLKARMEFFSKAIASAIRLSDVAAAVCWMETCDQMAASMQIDNVSVRVYFIEQLLLHGMDQEAFRAAKLLSDTSTLGEKLLEIGGKRLAHLLTSVDAEKRVIILSQIPPQVTTWIKTQSLDAIQSQATVADVESLVNQALTYLPEDGERYEFTLKLADVLNAIGRL